MHQELLESKGSQAGSVQEHRFGLVAPGALGVYNPDGPKCNEENKAHLEVLVRNLNKMVKDDNESRSDAVADYLCRHCFRSLYRSSRHRFICACLRCISVLYCTSECRDVDVRSHRFTCFLHPAWECEESSRRRVAKTRAAGENVKPLKDAKSPEIEAQEDPREDPDEEVLLDAEDGEDQGGGGVQGDGEKTADDGGEPDA